MASNIAYLIAGLMGLYLVQDCFMDDRKFRDKREALPFFMLFLGSVLLAFGSGYYHLIPDNETLVADRLTMMVVLMGFTGFMIVERISLAAGLKLLPLLLCVALLSVLYWYMTEIAGAGDLRLYALTQLLPLVAIAIMLLAFPAPYSGQRYIWLTLALYSIAKIFERYDHEIWARLPVSGHTLKHLISGVGVYLLVLYLKKRRPL